MERSGKLAHSSSGIRRTYGVHTSGMSRMWHIRYMSFKGTPALTTNSISRLCKKGRFKLCDLGYESMIVTHWMRLDPILENHP